MQPVPKVRALGGCKKFMGFKGWLTAIVVMTFGTTLMAADTAQKQDPLVSPDKTTKIFKTLQLNKSEVGVYYVPPSDIGQRGYLLDDIPREEVITTQAMLTQQRMAKEGTFVKFSTRQISYSLMETEDDSLRVNYYPSRSAAMLSWTHAFPIGD